MTRTSPARIILYVISALVLVYLILPVLIIAPISFSSARFLTFPPPSFSLRWYQQYFANPAWMQARTQIRSPRFIAARRLAPYTCRSTDVGVVLDLMIHDLDLVLNLIPEEVVDVQAVGAPVIGPHEDGA